MTTNQRHRRIWTEIAEAFDTPPMHRTKLQLKLTVNGLCWAYGGGRRSWLHDHWPKQWTEIFGDYAFPLNTAKGNAGRATFSGLFAAMTKREWKAMLDD